MRQGKKGMWKKLGPEERPKGDNGGVLQRKEQDESESRAVSIWIHEVKMRKVKKQMQQFSS